MLSDPQIYSFGSFVLNTRTSRLELDNKSLHITPKAFSLLVVLVQNSGEVLTKERLLDEVWGGTFVEEGNLSYNIRQLRLLLGDNAREPKFIETIPKAGYKFIAPVQLVEKAVPAAIDPELARRRAAADRLPWVFFRRLAAAFAVVIGVSVLILEGWLGVLSSRAPEARLLLTPYASEKLSTDGKVAHAIVSHNGRFVLYVSGYGKERQALRRLDLESRTDREILSPLPVQYGGLALSPADDTIFFARSNAATDELCIYRVDIGGGVPENLVCGVQGLFGLSMDGSRLSYVKCQLQADDYCTLFVADSSGANERPIVTRASPERIGDSSFSPDGKRLAFASGRSTDGSNEFRIRLIDLDSLKESPATDIAFANVQRVRWLPDGSTLLATARLSHDESNYFWHLDPETQSAIPFRRDAANYNGISLDHAGQILVTTAVEDDFNVDVIPLDASLPPQAIGRGFTARYTSDGRLIFVSDRTGRVNLWSAGADGNAPRQITTDGSTFAPAARRSWEKLYFASNRSGRFEIWETNADGTNARQITDGDGGFPLAVSPDGNWLYYLAAGDLRLMRVDIASGTVQEIFNSRRRGLSLSPSTRYAASVESDGRTSALIIEEVGAARPHLKLDVPPGNIRLTAWAPDGLSIFFITAADEGGGVLWEKKLDGSAPVRVRELNAGILGERAELSISPDKKAIALTSGTWKHNAILLKGLN